MKNSKVWVVTGTSESNDHYGPYVFAKKPTEKQLKEICELDCGDWSGPGDFGSYIFLSTKECEVK